MKINTKMTRLPKIETMCVFGSDAEVAKRNASGHLI